MPIQLELCNSFMKIIPYGNERDSFTPSFTTIRRYTPLSHAYTADNPARGR